MKRTWFLPAMALAAALSFTACASSADTMPTPSQSPEVSQSPSAQPSPSATAAAPTMTVMPTTQAGVNTVEDAMRASEAVGEEVEKLSELDTAEAVVAGNIALIGVKYDAQYQGGLTDRMIEMVEARVEAVDKTLTAVRVTDDEAAVQKIEALSEQLMAKQVTFDQLQTQVLAIASQLGGGGATDVAEPQSTAGA